MLQQHGESLLLSIFLIVFGFFLLLSRIWVRVLHRLARWADAAADYLNNKNNKNNKDPQRHPGDD